MTRFLLLPDSLAMMLCGLERSHEYVFTYQDQPVDEGGFYKRWKRVLTKQAIVFRKPYNTRHTFISHALAQGINPMLIAHQTGHDPKVLFDHYAGYLQSSPKLPNIFA